MAAQVYVAAHPAPALSTVPARYVCCCGQTRAVEQVTDITAHEDQLRGELRALPERQLVEAATSMLAETIERVPDREAVVIAGTPIHNWRSQSYTVIALRVYRAIRSAVSVLGAGFELEAQVYDRLLLELMHAYLKIASDESGQLAKRWLRGKKIAGAGDAIEELRLPKVLHGHLSERAHGSSAPVWQALASREEDRGLVTWGPARGKATHGLLLNYAAMARTMIEVLAREHQLEVPQLPALDRAYEALLADFVA